MDSKLFWIILCQVSQRPQFDFLHILSKFFKMFHSIIKACFKNFSVIGSVFLKLHYSKVLDSPYEKWHSITR